MNETRKKLNSMNEHENFKEICNKIGYKYGYDYNRNVFTTLPNNDGYGIISIRDMIFNQEFINKYKTYYFKNSNILKEFYNGNLKELNSTLKYEIELNQLDDLFHNHLNDPVSYLIKLIK